jgi:two-component system, OmpR family, sensor histidine kinase SenX3
VDAWGVLGVAIVALAVIASVGWVRAVRMQRTQQREAAGEVDDLRSELGAAEESRRIGDVVLSTMADGILLMGADGRVVYANGALGGLLPSAATSLEALLPLALRTAIVESRRDGGPASIVLETGVPTRWLRATIAPAEEGATLVVIRDVTEQHRLEAVRRDFVANASHELKTPAATIQATAETLRQAAEDDPPAVARFASQLEREAVRLSRIVADLLDLSRLESGSALDDLVSLGATARDETQRLEEAANRAGVSIRIATDGDRPVRGSQQDLALLVRNLIDNAVRASHEGGSVTVEVSSEGDDVVLRVRDTGIGIPSRDIPRIFERFYRVDRARSRETGGTGLGLAIVKHIVENHGGRVEVESELGSGSTFLVSLPAAEPTLEREAGPAGTG